MKRRLSKRVEWDAETRELELLDWESNPADFERLFLHVTNKLNDEFRGRGVDIVSIASEEELRKEVREGARTFEAKYVSLIGHVYWRAKAFLISRQKGLKW
jgi:hypothetical protein